MRVLVIGGTGFIGPHVVRRLSDLGHDVTVYHRGQTEADLPPDVRHIHDPEFNALHMPNRQSLANFADQFRRWAPEVVLDMIPNSEAEAGRLMQTFAGIARRVVAISSQDVYRAYSRFRGKEPGPPDPVPLTEDSPLREKFYPYRGDQPRRPDDPSRWVDDYEKILVERVVMGNPDLPGTILRLPAVYGPNDGQHRLFYYLKRMDDGRPAILLDAGLARWRWSRGYVEEVAFAITLAVTQAQSAGRIYNVAEVEALTEAEWVRRIGDAAGWAGRVLPVPALGPYANRDFTQHWVVDTTRIRTELGYAETVSQAEGLRRTIAWQRATPPPPINPAEFDYAAEDKILAALTPDGAKAED